jgi:hypothetical protein
MREGATTADGQRMKELERESKELRRTNEILKVASAFLPRRSSTADSSPEGAHRRASRYVRGRADLLGSADLPFRIDGMQRFGATPRPCLPRCRTIGRPRHRDHTRSGRPARVAICRKR